VNRLRTNSRVLARSAAISAVVLALAITAAGIAYAAFPTGGGNLRACANNSTGVLRLLNTGQTCTAKETAIRIASADATGRVADAQKLDGRDSAAFVQNGSVAGGSLTGTYPNPALRQNSVFGAHISDTTFSDGDIVPNTDGGLLKSFHIPNSAIQGAEIADNTVTGIDVADNTLSANDIDELSLPALDGVDAFTKKCDPHPDSGFIVCASVSFTTLRQMPVFMTVVYSIYHEITDQDANQGECKTRLDGVDQGSVPNGDVEPGSAVIPDAGVPIVDVISVAAGTHSLDFLCKQSAGAASPDIVYGDIRLAVIELGMD
jgi:hypothetical protein